MNLKPFYTSVLVSTVLLYAGAYLGTYLSKKEMPVFVWFLIPLYAILTIVLFRIIANSVQKNPTRFVTAVYASVLIKLLLSMSIVGVYFFMQYPGKKAFAIAMLGIYAVYTSVLIRSLIPIVKGDKPQTSQ